MRKIVKATGNMANMACTESHVKGLGTRLSAAENRNYSTQTSTLPDTCDVFYLTFQAFVQLCWSYRTYTKISLTLKYKALCSIDRTSFSYIL